MFPQVMRAVCGEVPSLQSARLPGFRRYTVKNQFYPAIEYVPRAGVDGVLYRDVSLQLLKRLDRYEGREYRRVRLRVTLGQGLQALAWVYLPRQAPAADDEAVDWSAAEFEQRHLDHWCRQLLRSRRHPLAR